jgi:hypothetical protein
MKSLIDLIMRIFLQPRTFCLSLNTTDNLLGMYFTWKGIAHGIMMGVQMHHERKGHLTVAPIPFFSSF